MSLKIVTTFILACSAIPVCYSQIDYNNQSADTSVKTVHISRYDTFSSPINFEFFDHTGDLPKGIIEDVIQTEDGYLWISIWNYGLVRYDGYQFRSFKPRSTQYDPVHLDQLNFELLNKICQ